MTSNSTQEAEPKGIKEEAKPTSCSSEPHSECEDHHDLEGVIQ